MKRMSQDGWLRLVRLSAARRQAEKRRRLVKLGKLPPPRPLFRGNPLRRAAERYATTLPRKRINRRAPWRPLLCAPDHLHFGTDHDGVALFGQGIGTLFGGHVTPYLDFTGVKSAGPAAALYIAAEIERWQNFVPAWRNTRVYDFEEWDPRVRRYLGDLGLYDLLHVTNPPHETRQRGEARVLKMRRKNLIHADSVSDLRDELQTLCQVPNRLGFFDAVSEAMNNVIHHAYQGEDSRGWPWLEDNWWMTADFDPATSSLRVAFLDQGVGIPARLPRSNLDLLEALMTRLGLGSSDADRITAALQYGRSSTGVPGRGKGFHDMQMFVDGDDHNWMRVLSGRGECVYRSGEVQSKEHDHPIVGTVVEWSLVVPTIAREL